MVLGGTGSEQGGTGCQHDELSKNIWVAWPRSSNYYSKKEKVITDKRTDRHTDRQTEFPLVDSTPSVEKKPHNQLINYFCLSLAFAIHRFSAPQPIPKALLPSLTIYIGNRHTCCVREVVKKSKWKFKMAFAIRGPTPPP